MPPVSDPLEGTGAQTTGDAAGSSSPTRGFLFADLRDYTPYLEKHGAAAAAELLARYYAMVRGAVARYGGAEIKTEGDSFYVVFSAVSAAVHCGLAITEGARETGSGGPGDLGILRVGVGVHAGETVDTPEGFVGSPINIAQRICSVAPAGQVLVSDTVRALTQTVLPVTFTPFGRRQLKGVREPMLLYVAAPADPVAAAAAAHRQRRIRVARWVAVAAVVAVLAAGAVWWQTRPPPGLPPGPWTIGLSIQLTGDEIPGAGALGLLIRDAVQLAIEDVNAAGDIGGSQLVLDARDDGGLPDGPGPGTGAANTTAFIRDPKTVAMIGPLVSNVAQVEIPLTNMAGLLQCSPASSLPGLTKPRDGALDLRKAFPTRINFVRTLPADDIQGVALGSFVFRDLSARKTLVIDDGNYGREIADNFTAAYQKLGGLVIHETLNKGTQPSSVLGPLSGADAPTAVFFGGFADTGAVAIRQAMVAAGKAAVPFVSWDGISGGTDDPTSFLSMAGSAAAGSFYSHAAIALPKADFVDRYRTRFGHDSGEFGASAYACTQVIAEAMRAVAATGPSAAGLREAVRAYAVDPAHRFETVIGTVGFDANGDDLQQFVSFYKVDTGALGGKGDWIFVKQADYGPAS
jgi:branched-chain amino acid transport system substrate-binding protein